MPTELKNFVVNMKSLSQDIEDPIIQGAGDANGRTFRIIFTQEAAEQFTPETKVYLKWYHEQLKTRGYNVFRQVQAGGSCGVSPIWEINWPQAMLHEGDVLCCIEIVDDISIAPSNNFIVHVLSDPNDGSNFVVSDDYSVFKQAVIDMNAVAEKSEAQFQEQQEKFDDIVSDFNSMWGDVNLALRKANAAIDLAQEAIKIADMQDTAMTVQINEY